MANYVAGNNKTYLGLMQIALHVVLFQQNQKYLERFSRYFPASTINKISPVTAALIHVDRRTWQT